MKVPGVDALREALGALNLDTRGHKAELKKRLRSAKKRDARQKQARKARHMASNKRPLGQDFDSYLVLDFEATCQKYEECHGSYFGFPNEIIEFPVLLLQWRPRKVASSNRQHETYEEDHDGTDTSPSEPETEDDDDKSDCDETDSEASWSLESEAPEESQDLPPSDATWELVPIEEFRRFVKPTWRPKLTQFCTDLTGITQIQVDRAQTFIEVLADFESCFIPTHDLFSKGNKTVWVTDGPWDLRDFVAKQCYISGIERPLWMQGPYIDLRTAATAYFSRNLPPVQNQPPNGIVDEGTSLVPIPTLSPVSTRLDLDTNSQPAPVATVTEEANGFIQVGGMSPSSTTSSIQKPTTRGLATPNIPAVLKALGLQPFEGRQHSGIDDVRNIARILQELVRPERQWRVSANACVEGKERRWSWMKKNGKIAWIHPPGI